MSRGRPAISVPTPLILRCVWERKRTGKRGRLEVGRGRESGAGGEQCVAARVHGVSRKHIAENIDNFALNLVPGL